MRPIEVRIGHKNSSFVMRRDEGQNDVTDDYRWLRVVAGLGRYATRSPRFLIGG